MKRIGVFTSGGDSPGMNACIRAVVRSAIDSGLEVCGIKRGYNGIIAGDIEVLNSRNVSNIIQRGGTFLKSARSKEFMTIEGRQKAHAQLMEKGIDGLVAIGGDGTFTGAMVFEKEFGFPMVGIPGTIDNDLYGTDSTIGYDTALNTVVESVDKIRDTAHSHDRLFIVEVMGRDAGFIALRSGIAVGAEAILVPETTTYIEQLLHKIQTDWKKNKTSSIVVVAEGDDYGGAYKVADAVREKYDHFDIKVTILGHLQRGGAPSAYDRVLASRLGVEAVRSLKSGKNGVMIGVQNNQLSYTPFEKAIKYNKELNQSLLELVRVLSI